MATIEDVIAEHGPALAALPGVSVVAQGKSGGEDCILIMVESERYLPEIEAAVPAMLQGYRVIFQVGGIIQAHRGPPGR